MVKNLFSSLRLRRFVLSEFLSNARTIFSSRSVRKVGSSSLCLSRGTGLLRINGDGIYEFAGFQRTSQVAALLSLRLRVRGRSSDDATRCNAMQRNAMQCNAMQRDTFRRRSLCNTFTMQLHQRRVSSLRAYARANERTRARTRVDRR